MSIKSRLDRLEDRLGGGACPECGSGSEGPVTIRSTAWGDPEPRPCPSCGAEPHHFTLTLDSPNDAGAERPDTL